MTFPSKAIILAAGLGERMRPLSSHRPKAMMPFAGKPILEHTVSSLKSWGVTDILINLHHAPSPLVDYVRTREFQDIRVSFSFEPEIRGTGGALKQAAWFVEGKPFWIVNSDIIFELDPRALLNEFNRTKALACLWVTSRAGPRTVDIRNGKIQCFASKRPGAENTATFCGIHLVSPRILKLIPDATFSSIVPSYTKALKLGRKVLGIEVPASYWADIGSPEKLLDCHRQLSSAPAARFKVASQVKAHLRKSRRLLSSQGVEVSGAVSCGTGVAVSRSSKLKNCILGDGVEIGPNSSVTDCIVAPGVAARGNLRRAVVDFDAAFDIEDRAALESRAWPGSGVVVEALPPRGSNRKLYRLHGAKRPSLLIKYDSAARPENAKFTKNLTFLNSLGLPVPALLLDIPSQNICIVEDLGDASMQTANKDIPPHIRNELYRQIVRFTAMLHSKGAHLAKQQKLRLEPPFTANLYRWERDLFAEHYLSGTLQLSKPTVDQIQKELRGIPSQLKGEKVLIHRDLQSSNIMLKAGRPIFIDFQGMRLGSRYYDLASLLLDPYVCLEAEVRRMLIKEYAALTGLKADKVEHMTHIAGIQRLAQALGAFGRLRNLDGMGHFADYIQPALGLMSNCMAYTLRLPALADLVTSERI